MYKSAANVDPKDKPCPRSDDPSLCLYLSNVSEKRFNNLLVGGAAHFGIRTSALPLGKFGLTRYNETLHTSRSTGHDCKKIQLVLHTSLSYLVAD